MISGTLENPQPVEREGAVIGMTIDQLIERKSAEQTITTPVETPVEQPVQTASTVETPVEQPQPTQAEIDYIALFKEKTGIDFESVDQIKEALQPKKNDLDEAPQDVKEYINWRKAGGDPTKFFQEKATDYSKLADVDVVRLAIKQKNPNYSDQLVEDIIAEQYATDYVAEEGDDVPRNVRIAQQKLAADAVQYREELNKSRIDFSQHFVNKEILELKEKQEKEQQFIKEFAEKASSVPLDKIEAVAELTDENGEKYSIDFAYNVPSELQKAVKEYIVNPSKLAEKHSKDGVLDMQSLGKDLVWLDPKVRQAYANDVAKVAIERFMKSLRNSTLNPVASPRVNIPQGEDVAGNREAFLRSRGIK